MDGSKPRTSDAAATRKRRSSILKSQRSVRAPLSELEFNVATPPDQAKSRRVSFSRRTGVAEFEINEATTAWKNVYEEHNKSLESSANESGMKAAPRRVAHLGMRASHFTDDEADAVDASAAPPGRAERSQLAELSQLAAHNTVQLFRLDANPALGELTDDLRVDFSAVARLDDLDALQHDLDSDARRPNISEYSIDVDFNSTHISLKADDDDMSITDTIRSPTVAASETRSQVDWTADKENIVVNPYVTPKASDNFAVSDDCEDVLVFDGKKCKFQSNLDLSDDEILSRTLVYDTTAGDMSVTQAVVRVVLPARDEVDITRPGRVGQRTVLLDHDMTVTGIVPAQILSSDLGDDRKPSRTIVYDDATADMSVTQVVARVAVPARDEVTPGACEHKTIFLDDDMAVTRAVSAQLLQSEDLKDDDDGKKPSRTIVYDDAAADMSVTQVVARVAVPARDEVTPGACEHKTIFLDDDMAVTRAVSAQLLQSEDLKDDDDGKKPSRTIVYDDAAADMSVTRAVERLLLPAQDDVTARTLNDRKTILDMAITRTQILSSEDRQENKMSEPNATRRRTVVFGNDDGDISVTQAVPTNIINAKSSETKQPQPYNTTRQGTMYFEDITDMSVTQAVPVALIPEPRRKTIVFHDDNGHISMTEAVPAGALLAVERRDCLIPELDNKPENTERRRTILYNNEDADISVTGVVIADIHEAPKWAEAENIGHRKSVDGAEITKYSPVKEGNISKTQEVPSNIINTESSEIIQPEPKQRTMYFEDIADMSVTQAVPLALVEPPRRKTIVLEDDDKHLSMTEAVPAGALLTAARKSSVTAEHTEHRRMYVYNNEDGNISITGLVTTSIHVPEFIDPKRSPEKEGEAILYDVDSMRPQVSPGSSPEMSKYTLNALFDAMSNSPKRESLGGTPNGSERTSILDVLLDMSQASVEALAIEYIPDAVTQATASSTTLTNTLPASNTTITTGEPRSEENEREEAVKKETKENVSNLPSSVEGGPERPALEGSLPLPIEHKNDKHGIVCKLQHKLSELKDHLQFKERPSPRKRNSKSINNPRYTQDERKSSLNSSLAPPEHSVELRERLPQMNDSDLKPASPEHDKIPEQENKTLTINLSSRISTHDSKSSPEQAKNRSLTCSNQECDVEPGQKEQSQWTGQDDTRAILDALSALTDTSIQNKPASPDHSRRSSAPDRKSMVMSRENLLRELSLAQAIMKTEMQQTEEMQQAESSDEQASPPHLSNEVVKTLRFEDDDSIVEPRVLNKPSVVQSPPRRASTVIPTYDVSERAKELVHELIKPMADADPRSLPDFPRTEASRGSQVDTFGSSQIDLIPWSPVLIEPRLPSCLRSPKPVAVHSEMLVEHRSPSPSRLGASEAAVIVFDHLNPLNNILLPPPDQSVVHRYNPRRSQESLDPSLDSQAIQTEEQSAQSRNVDCGLALVTAAADRAAAGGRRVRDTEANTSIVMKGNRELLAASSSLTLVDDALARSAFDVTAAVAGAGRPRSRSRSRSPVRVIFKLDDPYSSVKLGSELTSCDDSSEGKRHKRGHVASKGPEVTPKPATKVQKVSNSAKVARRPRSPSPSDGFVSPSSDSRSSAASSGTVSTVAAVWSCARAAGAADAERARWQPELVHDASSKDLACERDPGVNVVAKIDVLPFMGTSECEWESRAADTWSFRLLRARLRLLVRLEHRACNTTRAAVRADTPVRLVLVQHARDSGEDPVASLCLCLAAEALQRVAARGCARAGMVPGLLRRCAALARVARRWGRAMRAARALLAFTLADDGVLSLKVANIPLRSVWEVRLRVELVDAARGVPWPRAVAPRVCPVVAAWAPAQRELQALLDSVPEDWGHVPRTVWKIFKYLKNKRPEDDLLTA